MVQISIDGYYSERMIIDIIPDKLNIAYAKLQSIYLGEAMQPKQLQPKQFGTVRFDSQPHGADIIVDGQILINPDTEEAIKTPATVLLYEGRRDFIIRLKGHDDAIGYVDVLAGTTVEIFRNLKPGTKEAEKQVEWTIPEPQIWLNQYLSQQTGILRIYSFPDGADTYVNGRYIGKAPLIVTDIPTGVATVEFRMPGMMDEEKIVDIVEGAWSETYATMRPVLPKLSFSQPMLVSKKSMNEIKSMNVGNVTIFSNPSGANIYVDGTLMINETGNPVTTPVTLSLYAGSHFIEICKEGYEIEFYRVYIYEESNIEIESNLFPSPYYMSQIPEYAPENPKIPYYTPIQSMECPSATEGIVVMTTYPAGATIIMDGKTLIDMDTGEPLTTPVDLSVEMGYHDLIFKLNGFFDEFDGIYVEPRYHQYLHKNFNFCGYC